MKGMKVLVIGSGGREHALVWKIAQSSLVEKIFCAPGNAGISRLAECIDIKAEDLDSLLSFVRKERIDLTVVGPESSLALGIVDKFNSCGLKIFGPSRSAALLEASKVFSKSIMAKYGVPTAAFKVFQDSQEADSYIDMIGTPCVIKADGLAAGKGVIVAKSVAEAKQAVASMMKEKVFGEAGRKIIIEECLVGQEASILVLTDSNGIVPLATAQDHKRVFDADMGPNTGGMGAYSPAPVITKPLFDEIMEKIINRTIGGLMQEGIEYRGVLYAGVMLTSKGPMTLEFNARFGDPETQAILPRLKTDLVEVMLAIIDKKLSRYNTLDWHDSACVCVVCTSGGYPGEYKTGREITGLDEVAGMKNVVVFHAGTKLDKEKIVTSAGRVLGVTGTGASIKEAIELTYKACKKIDFEGMHYRKDIGARALIL